MADHVRRAPSLRDLALGALAGAVLVTAMAAVWPRQPAATAAPGRVDAALCSRALAQSGTAWDSRPVFQRDVAEAQRLALTLDACRDALGLAEPPAASGSRAPGPAPGAAPQPPLALAEYNGHDKPPQPVTLRYRDIEVVLDSAPPQPPADQRVPLFIGRYQGKQIFSLRLDDAVDWHDVVAVRRLDPATAVPQIVLSAYTGGAHCCTVTRIATLASDGWHLVDAGTLDGEEPYSFLDLDGDGAAELVSADNAFLYAFDCYACSLAPSVIQTLSGLALRNVTREPRFRPFIHAEVRRMDAMLQQGDIGNGFLAGWVAENSLGGNLAAAWHRMLGLYRPGAFEICLDGAPAEQCPGGRTYQAAFPQALAGFLVANGYLTPAQSAWLGKLGPQP